MSEAICGLLGRSLKHSFSVDIHRELGIPQYHLYELEPEQLDVFFTKTAIGLLNVTIPYKKDVMRFCAALSPEAQAIGSVNTIVSTPTGLTGHNTDASGFAYMAKRAGISFTGKKVLIFGSGGASVAVRYVAEQAGAAHVALISRSGEDTYETLTARHSDAEILVNATPVGMYPNAFRHSGILCGSDTSCSPETSCHSREGGNPSGRCAAVLDSHLRGNDRKACGNDEARQESSGVGEWESNSIVDLACFPRCEGVLDLVYNPLRTALLMQAEERGIAHEGGLPMLVAQAKAAEELFLGHEIPDAENERILGLLYAEKENIVLIGMPGSGKSTIGAALAQMTGRELVDLDEKIVLAAKKSIPEIFSQHGEEVFRRLESEQAAQYGAKPGLIIATGGGIVTREHNYALLHQNGRIYHVIRDTSLLGREGRPLSLKADLEQLYRERLPLYTRFRDVLIENSGTPEQAAEKIRRDFDAYTRH